MYKCNIKINSFLKQTSSISRPTVQAQQWNQVLWTPRCVRSHAWWGRIIHFTSSHSSTIHKLRRASSGRRCGNTKGETAANLHSVHPPSIEHCIIRRKQTIDGYSKRKKKKKIGGCWNCRMLLSTCFGWRFARIEDRFAGGRGIRVSILRQVIEWNMLRKVTTLSNFLPEISPLSLKLKSFERDIRERFKSEVIKYNSVNLTDKATNCFANTRTFNWSI